jgi:ABC-type glycerol-3-phosphate transport system substrate-binding protein
MVLYWNRDLLTNASYAQPPRYWDEVHDMADVLTRRDAANNVVQSTVAFGEYDNVNHAKEIVSTLIQQAGGEIVQLSSDGRYEQRLTSVGTTGQPAEYALRFYTEFADPAKDLYSWNRSRPMARNAFATGDLALYIGYASELPLIRELNPNLNFAVSIMPQPRGARRSTTFGRVYVFAFPKNAGNINGAIEAAFLLAGSSHAPLFAAAWGIPSARRDVLAEPKDEAEEVFRQSALIARGWLDPDPQATDRIFERMIENVTSGAARLGDAIQRADQELLDSIENVQN